MSLEDPQGHLLDEEKYQEEVLEDQAEFDLSAVKNSDSALPTYDDKQELINHLKMENSLLRAERDEYKTLLFEKVGLVKNQPTASTDENRKPLRVSKTWSQKKGELTNKYKKPARDNKENHPPVGDNLGTITE